MRAFTLALTLLLGLVVAVNGLAAWDTRKHEGRIRAAATGFVAGRVLADYRDTDERRFQRARLAVIPRPRLVAFGSSRIQPLSTAMVGLAPGEFYNAGLSGGTVEDFIVLWAVLKANDRVPERALFAVDQWQFNRMHEQVRWLEWADEVNRFAEASGDGARPLGLPLDATLYAWLQARELVSYSVLRASLKELDRRRAGRERRGAEVIRSLERDLVPEARLEGRRGLRADGSLVYDHAAEAQTPAQVREEAARFASGVHAGLGDFRWDDARAGRLERLWMDMRARGVRIIAYMPPFHPSVVAFVRRDARYADALGATDAFLARLAARTDAKYVDLTDPASVPCAEAEFLDGSHGRAGCLARSVHRALR